MVRGETILCLSPSSWFSLWRNRQQIMSRLATHNIVLFVEPQRDSEYGIVRDRTRRLRHLVAPGIQQVRENLWAIEPPPSFPFGIFSSNLARWITPVNNYILTKVLRHAMRLLQVRAPILWLYYPWHVGLVGRFDEKLVCYHVYDELADYPFHRRLKGFIERCDRELCQKADLVLASSSAQAERRKSLNAQTYFVPNAADFAHFKKALDPDLPLPDDVQRVPRPRIGYVGLLGFQVNTGLLLDLANMRPDWHLVLVGPDRLGESNRSRELRKLENVHFLGQKRLEELPAYLKACDVALLPYDLATHMSTSYPLKLHEYLAAGKPVVSVPLRELLAFQDVVYFADSATAFVQSIARALEQDSVQRIQRRVTVAQENTWDRRVEQISALIDHSLRDKQTRDRVS